MKGVVILEPTPQQKAQAVIDTESREHSSLRQAGDTVYLVSSKWFAAWCAHTGFSYDPQQRKLLETAAGEVEPGPPPGPIYSSELIDPEPSPGDLSPNELVETAPLRAGLKEKEDFWVLYEATWKLLKEWYGVAGPEITRQYVAVGQGRRLEVDHEQWHVKAVDEHSGCSVVVATLRMGTVLGLKEACCRALDLDFNEHVIVSFPGTDKENMQPLEDKLTKTLAGVHLHDRQAVLLRRKDHPEVAAAAAAQRSAAAAALPIQQLATGGLPASSSPVMATPDGPGLASLAAPLALPAPVVTMAFSPTAGGSSLSPRGGHRLNASPTYLSTSPLSRSYSKVPLWAEDASIPSSGRRAGLAGLGNLGNTCFMNSSIQCLMHTVPLMKTFLTGAYRSDLNRDNPLGLGGKLAVAFGGLMGKLWKGDVAHVSPKHFKWQLGKFAPQFGGYAQQDSQELLAFLLDGLHEDLNRITVKPYREEKDAEGRPDEEVAAEAWDNYRARNDSVVVDHFQGLYKSTLRCPDCDNQSVKFDPFMYLSLPLPSAKNRVLRVTVINTAGTTAPLEVAIEVPKSGTVADALAALSALAGDALAGKSAPLESRWLLAQWAPKDYNKFEPYFDLSTPLANLKEHKPPRANFFPAFSSAPSQTLVAYRYPEGGTVAGPGGGRQPVVIFHRAGMSSTLIAPSVVFLQQPGDEEHPPPLLSLSPAASGPFNTSKCWAVRAAGDALEAPLRAFVAPFLKQGVAVEALLSPRAPDAAVEPAVEAVGEDAPEAMLESAPCPLHLRSVSFDGNMDVDALRTEEERGGEGGPIAAVATAAAAEEGGSDFSRPGTPAKSLNGAPSTSSDGAAGSAPDSMPELDMDPHFSIGGDAAAAGTAGGSENVAAGVSYMGLNLALMESSEPVVAGAEDPGEAMAVENNATPDHQLEEPLLPLAAPAAAAAGPASGVQLLLGDRNGTARSAFPAFGITSFAVKPPALPQGESEPVFIVAEWPDAAKHALDLSSWTHPAQHDSVSLATASPRPVSLGDCVDAFLKPERLDESDSWYCSGCKAHVRAEKKLDLWRLPEVLVVHLKRFSYSRYSRDKIDTAVEFPLRGLDLREVVPESQGGTRPAAGGTAAAASSPPPLPPPVYDLFAVSNHYGGLGGGHYTAYARMPDDGKWYQFDDSAVTEMEEEAVRSPAAYVLFYRRRGAEEGEDVAGVITVAAAEEEADAESPTAAAMDVGCGGFGSALLQLRRTSVGTPLEQVTEDMEDGDGSGKGKEDDVEEIEEEEGQHRAGKPSSLAAHALAFTSEDGIDDDEMEDI